MASLKKSFYLIVSILLFITAIIIEDNVLNNHPEKELIANFQKTFNQQEKLLDIYLDTIAKGLDEDVSTDDLFVEFEHLQGLSKEHGLGFMVLEGDEILYWSDNSFAFSPYLYPKIKNDSLLVTPNGVFYVKRKVVQNYQVAGLIYVKNKYPLENQYLKNEFAFPFELPGTYQLTEKPIRNAFSINSIDTDEVFYIIPRGVILCNESQLYFPSILYFIGFIFLLFFVRRQMKDYKEIFILKISLLAGSLFMFYWLHVTLGIPTLFRSYSLFTPEQYASSDWIPSLGDFLLISILIFFWSVNFIKEFFIPQQAKKHVLFYSVIFVALMYVFCGYLISDLVINSNISLKLSHISDFDLYSLVAYVSIALLLFSVFLINHKIIDSIWQLRDRRIFIVNGLTTFVLIGLSVFWHMTFLVMLTLFALTSLLLFVLKIKHKPRFSLSYIILFVVVYSIFSIVVIYSNIKKRDIQVQKLMAVNLSTEHDPVAEVFLADVQYRMSTDSIIPTVFDMRYDELEGYLIRNYFSGYFSSFDIQITICTEEDSVLIQPDNSMEPCFPFFEEMIKTSGTKLPGCNFYHMNNMNGLTSYLGRLHYPVLGESVGVSIFIELNSKAVSEGIGFPELLMDKSLIKPEKYKNLSHAKYFHNDLVHRHGDYMYNYYFLSYDITKTDKEFQLLKWDGYDHLVYNLGSDNYIIVSNKSLDLLDFLISFPYIFVFYVVIALIIIFIGNTAYREQAVPYDLKFKIQAAIISTVLISLVIVAMGTLYYNVNEYERKHQIDLQDKMRSISEEIANRLVQVNEITPDLHAWLLRELHKLSNIFATDINIYGVNGELLATSRPEIFNKGIISTQMNSEAYYQLFHNYKVNYFQPEKIGELEYLSAYEPIINNNGNYLGFLNLPYFTKEDSLNQEISTFIVAFINLYVLLFLASVIVAVLLANQITRPLSIIREKLKGIQLGKKGEQINYSANDEIGALVKDYNKKVDELAESAELLAKTERDLAWREMAKQIAHEIKNPLTPMKLHVQYLQRAKSGGVNIDEHQFEKVTKTLIEQIDNLSEIATEFSNFAKTPRIRNEEMDLVEKLKNVVSLFEANPKNKFILELNKLKSAPIFADNEQLSSSLVNLMKNAIQAIPEDKEGVIKVGLQKNKDKFVVSISDNGTGIREEVRERLFEPNFTTKTSGMGLGLAIVKNIVDSMHGRIWYETEMGVGTTFYIEIPVYK